MALFQVYQLVKDRLQQHKMRAHRRHRGPVPAAVTCPGALPPELSVRGDVIFLRNQIVLLEPICFNVKLMYRFLNRPVWMKKGSLVIFIHQSKNWKHPFLHFFLSLQIFTLQIETEDIKNMSKINVITTLNSHRV